MAQVLPSDGKKRVSQVNNHFYMLIHQYCCCTLSVIGALHCFIRIMISVLVMTSTSQPVNTVV